MIKRGSRIKVRTAKDYDMKLVGKSIVVGSVEEVTWAPVKGVDIVDGLMEVGVSLKLKDINDKNKSTPKDTLSLRIATRNPRIGGVPELIQNMKFAPNDVVNGDKTETAKTPEEFEEGVLYCFKGYMPVEE